MKTIQNDREKASIIKPLLLGMALLAATVSLTYAMVVTKTSSTAASPQSTSVNAAGHAKAKVNFGMVVTQPSPVTAQGVPVTSKGDDEDEHEIRLSRNPCATGDRVGILIAKSANDKDITVYVGNQQVPRKSASNRTWFGIYAAPNTGGNYNVRVMDDGKMVKSARLTVVELTGIYIFKDPVKSAGHKIINLGGNDNYVASKSGKKGDVVVYKATIKPNTPASRQFAVAKIAWTPPSAKLTDLKATLKADKVDGPTLVKAALGNTIKMMTNWIFWADLTIKITGPLDSHNHAPILVSDNWPTPSNYNVELGTGGSGLGGGKDLGPIDCLNNSNLNYAFTIGKIEGKAVLQPAGIQNIISSGWDMNRFRISIGWDNGVRTSYAPPPGTIDSLNNDSKYLNPINGDIFDLDGPGCSATKNGTTIDRTAEVYANFYQYVTVDFGGDRHIVSDLKKWSYMAQVDGDAHIIRANALTLSHITLPSQAYYPTR